MSSPTAGPPPDEPRAPRVSRRKATLENLVFAQMTFVLLLVRGFVLPPITLKHIDLRILGIWFILSNVVSWLMMSEGGAWLLLRQQVATEYSTGNRERLASAIGNGIVLLAGIGIFIGLSTVVVSVGIPHWFSVSTAEGHQLIVAFVVNGLAFALGLIGVVPRAVFQGMQEPRRVNAILFVAEALSLALTIVALGRGLGVLALAGGALMREGMQLLIGWPLLIVRLRALRVRPSTSFTAVREMLPLFLWSFIGNFSSVLRTQVDAFAVGVRLSPEAVPRSEYTRDFWDMCTGAMSKLITAVSPGLAHLHGEGDPNRVRAIQQRMLVVLSVSAVMILAGGWAMNESFMGIWLHRRDLYAGNSFNWLMGFAALMTWFSMSVSEVLYATGAIRDSATLQLSITMLRVGLLFALLPKFGLATLPATILISIVFGLVVSYRKVGRSDGKSALISGPDLAKLIMLVIAASLGARLLWLRVPAPHGWGELAVQSVAIGLLAATIGLGLIRDLRLEAVNAWGLATSRFRGRK